MIRITLVLIFVMSLHVATSGKNSNFLHKICCRREIPDMNFALYTQVIYQHPFILNPWALKDR